MASNTIKGLTVEIGGDTTKLGKALKDVESKGRSLSKELADINKLLQFDPGNADLLAQKQEVLAKAVENSAQKLETLKKAEQQVQEQFKRGEVSEEQVRALQREIAATEGKMKNYQKQARGVAEALEKMGDGADDASEEVEDTGKEAKTAAKKVDDFADAADKAEKASGGLGSTLANVAKTGFKAVGAAVGATVTGLTAAAEESREYRTEMGKLNAAYTSSGHSAKTAGAAYSELYSIIGETDQAVEAAQQIALLADSEEDVAKWSGLAAGVVGKFGDALQPETFFESANETLKLGEATGAYVQMLEGCGMSVEEFNAGLARCRNESERQAYMLRVTEQCLGSAGEAYKENNAEIIRANQANDLWMQSLAGIGAAMEPVLTDIKMMGASLLSELVPGVQALAESFRGLLNGEDGAAAGIGEALSGIITQLLNKVTELAPTLVQVAVSLITTLTTTLIAMLPQLVTAGVQIITTILSGLTSAIPQLVQAIVAMIPQLVQALVTGIPQLVQGAVQLFLAIMQAIPQILPPLIAAIPQIITTIVTALVQALPQVLQGALQMLTALVKAIPKILPPLVAALPQIINTLVNFFTNNIGIILDAAIELLMAIIEALPTIIKALTGALPKVINTIVRFLIDNIDVLVQAAITMFMAIIDALPTICDALVANLPQIISTIVNGLIDAVPKILSAALDLGGAIVQGLWQGIQNLGSWLWGKLSEWGSGIIDWVAGLFGIHSPSRVFRDQIGKNLGLGVAEGIEDSLPAVQNAMGDLGDAALNGPTLERDLQTRGAQLAAVQHTVMTDSMGAKLDKILAAIEAGQVIMLDRKQLVGGTASAYDNALGQRRLLAARGAL